MTRLITLTRLLAAAAALIVQQGVAMAQMPPQQPEAKSFKLGKLDIIALHDAQFVVPNDSKIFGLDHSQAEVSAVLQAAGASSDTVTLSVDALLVKSNRHVILIDTGNGGALQGSLAKAGVKQDAIDEILITHTHPDHVTGLVIDGKLAFPNATIRMSAAEWAYAKTNPKIAAIVKVVGDKVKTFKPGGKVAPGITSVALPGHTPGHVGYQIASGKQTLFDVGDTVHSSIISLVKPEWAVSFDGDQPEAEANRAKTLVSLVKSHEMIFAPHFPFPGIGYIETDGDHFKWDPTQKAD